MLNYANKRTFMILNLSSYKLEVFMLSDLTSF